MIDNGLCNHEAIGTRRYSDRVLAREFIGASDDQFARNDLDWNLYYSFVIDALFIGSKMQRYPCMAKLEKCAKGRISLPSGKTLPIVPLGPRASRATDRAVKDKKLAV